MEPRETGSRRSTPRPWGCFCLWSKCRSQQEVFPTPVGVFLQKGYTPPCGPRLPHARGGVSGLPCRQRATTMSSPRPWGCFCRPGLRAQLPAVFPTPVGVFLKKPPARCSVRSLPHARGGVSALRLCRRCAGLSSPRPWGCFQPQRRFAAPRLVFPTPVGVFPWTADET